MDIQPVRANVSSIQIVLSSPHGIEEVDTIAVQQFYITKFSVHNHLERMVIRKSQDAIECFCKFSKRQQIHIQITEETIAGKLWTTDTRKFAEKHRNSSRQFDELWELLDAQNSKWASKEYVSKSELQKIVESTGLNENEQLLKLWNRDPKKAMGSGIRNNQQNLKLIKEILRAENVPEFKWCFPAHLEKPETCYLSSKCLGYLQNWFKEECIPENKNRRKALILYSQEREYGKSTFAKSLVDHIDDYYIEIGGNSIAEKNVAPKPKAKLIIVDDMEICLRTHLEMWKKLLSSQRVNLRDAYLNYEFEGGLPVVVCTNSEKIFHTLSNSRLFKDQCYFVCLQDYMGPLGTKPQTLLNDEETNWQKYHYQPDDDESLVDPQNQPRKKKKSHTIYYDSSPDNSNGFRDPNHDSTKISSLQYRMLLDVALFWSSRNQQQQVHHHHYYNGMLRGLTENFMKEYSQMTQSFKETERQELDKIEEMLREKAEEDVRMQREEDVADDLLNREAEISTDKQDWMAESNKREQQQHTQVDINNAPLSNQRSTPTKREKKAAKTNRIMDSSNDKSYSSTRPSTAAKLTTERHLAGLTDSPSYQSPVKSSTDQRQEEEAVNCYVDEFGKLRRITEKDSDLLDLEAESTKFKRVKKHKKDSF